MQRGRGLPSHPSLPPNPQLHNGLVHRSQQTRESTQHQPTNIGALAAHALTSTLTNPYGSSSYSYTNANYHAYFTQTNNTGITSQGYTLSSTYVPNAASSQSQSQPSIWPVVQRSRPPTQRGVSQNSNPYRNHGFSGTGDIRCTHPGCTYSGAQKTVEIHMMDRHLIFPPGWKKRKPDWDADPSLKGKPVPIPGTGVMLNTPEAIDAWISERRKKWPTNQRVDDKRRKLQEAANRGEIDPSELTARGRKRRRVDGELPEDDSRGKRGRGRGRGDWRGGKSDCGWQGRGRGGGVSTRPSPGMGAETTRTEGREEGGTDSGSSSDNDSSGSSSDMDPVKDAVSSKAPNPEPEPRILTEELGNVEPQIIHDDDPHIDEHVASNRNQLDQGGRPARRQQPAQPKMHPPNPFASRPSLLRNLLLAEIRHTVSNLSQAIHFLVENDFLEGVELNPGDSDSQRIKVLESSTTERSNDLV